MGMFDDVEISNQLNILPELYRHSYQTKDLDCDGSYYKIDATGLFLKIQYFKDKPDKLFHSKNLNQDIQLYDFDHKLVVSLRNGEVSAITIGSSDQQYWDGNNPVWEEFIES